MVIIIINQSVRQTSLVAFFKVKVTGLTNQVMTVSVVSSELLILLVPTFDGALSQARLSCKMIGLRC